MRIIVIGAGLIGVSTAYFLRNSGHEIIVTDRNPGPGLETSFANGGMLTPSQAGPWNSPGISLKLLKWLGRTGSPLIVRPGALASLFPWGFSFLKNSSPRLYRENFLKNAMLAEYSLRTLQQLIEQNPISYERSCKGTVKLFRSDREFNQASSMLESINIEQIHYKLLDKDAVINAEPSLSAVKEQIAGGIYYPYDEVGDAHLYCNELARFCTEAGVKFNYNTSISGLLRQGKDLTGLDTSSGVLEADYYILAAGSYSPKLAHTAGISLPIKPVKGHSVTFYQGPGNFVPEIPVIDESRHIAITPFSDRLRISGTAELCGYDSSVNNQRVDMMIAFIKDLFPDMYAQLDLSTIQKWSGLRPYCSDGVPILGECKIKNLYLNTGHGHLGWTLAAGSGRLIADLICNGKTDMDINAYNLNRFNS